MTFEQDGPGRHGDVAAEGSGSAHCACRRGSPLGDLDPSLREFVEAEDEADADARLAALLEERAAPLVRAIAARKLRAYAGYADALAREDVEDVAADALLALVSKLQSLRADPTSTAIESFSDYTATVAYNAFAHHLRRRYPARSRLKNRLRYVLTRDRRFALWTTPDGLVCGLAEWRTADARAAATDRLDRLVAEPDRWLPWMRAHPRADDPAATVGSILRAVGGPVDFDRLVGAIAALSPPDAVETTRDAAALSSVPDEMSPPADLALERRRDTERLWQQIGSLPVRQRVALLLNLRDPQGAGMLWVFPLTGVASIRQIARILEIPDLEMAELWNRLPLDDLSIAARLRCTRQQVINLRSAARKRLTHRLAEGQREGYGQPAAGNTGAVSASVGNEA
jgi:RNA polymerase sigma factor (sigma-70 family)